MLGLVASKQADEEHRSKPHDNDAEHDKQNCAATGGLWIHDPRVPRDVPRMLSGVAVGLPGAAEPSEVSASAGARSSGPARVSAWPWPGGGGAGWRPASRRRRRDGLPPVVVSRGMMISNYVLPACAEPADKAPVADHRRRTQPDGRMRARSHRGQTGPGSDST